MTAKECILSRRSVRRFTEQPVDHELLAAIVATAGARLTVAGDHLRSSGKACLLDVVVKIAAPGQIH